MVKLRIISGKYKGRNLKGFDIDGTRPTMDRVKESLFAMIQREVKDANCLDLFAGSGALGIEALSNGANSCVFVDKNKIAINTLKENTKGISNATIVETDAFKLHLKINHKFNLVFLDPPYNLNLVGKSLVYLKEQQLLEKDAIVICESENEEFDNTDFEILKEKSYGSKKIKILKWKNA